MPALRLDAAIVHTNRADTAGNGQILGPDAFFDPLFLGAAERRFVTTERVVDNGALTDEGPLGTVVIHRMLTDGVAETPGGAHFTANPPDYGRDEAFQKEYAASAGDPAAWAAFAPALPRRERGRVPGPRQGTGRLVSDDDRACTRAESCVVACADAWRGAGEVMASPFGTIPALGARLAKLTFAPDLVLTDGEAALMVGAPPLATRARRAGPRGGHALSQRVRRGVVGPAAHHDDGQPDRPRRATRTSRPSATTATPRCSWWACGAHRATRSTTRPATGCPTTRSAASSSRSTWSAASATPGPRRPGRGATRFHDIRRVVSNLGVFDFETPERTMRLRSFHPGVTRGRRRRGHRLRAAPSPTTSPRPGSPPRTSSTSCAPVLDPTSLRDRDVKS